MAITELRPGTPCRFRRHAAAAAVASALAALSAPCAAADWKIAPSVGVRATYSDNIDLAPDAAARSDMVTEIIPGIAIDVDAVRFKAKAQYALHYIDYRNDTSASRTIHEAQLSANAELLKDLFYIEGAASSSLQNISAFGPVSVDSINAPGNSTEVRTYSVSPYLRKQFGDHMTAELRHTIQGSKTVDVNLVDARTDRTYASLHNGAAKSKWGWALGIHRQRIDYSDRPDVELGRYTGSLRYALSPRLSLKGTLGREENDYAGAIDDPSGALWYAGFIWTPTEATTLDAEVGRRFFGKTFNMAAQHRTPRTVWNLGFSEDVTTESAWRTGSAMMTSDFLDRLWTPTIPDAAARQKAVAAFIRDASLPSLLWSSPFGLSTRVFLQRSLNATVAIDGARNTVLLRANRTRREPLSAPDPFTPPGGTPAFLDENSVQTGASAVWTLHLSPRSNLHLGADYARVRSYVNGRVDHNGAIRIGLTRKFMERLSASVELRRQQRNSSDPGAEYKENALSVHVLMQF